MDQTPSAAHYAALSQVDLASPAHKADPFPFYAELRRTTPVFATRMRKRRAWLITRYEDVVSALKDDELFVKNRRNAADPEQPGKEPWIPASFRPLLQHLLEMDGSDHARLRALVHKAFTPARVLEIEGRVQSLAGELLAAARRRGEFDLINDYALRIPLTIISEMLGVAPADQEPFHRRVRFALEKRGRTPAIFLIPTALWIARFLRREIGKRKQDPKNDLLGALVQARENDDRLSEDELVSMIFILLVAGYETTANLIGSGALALLQHPDQRELLREKPELIKSAVEELVRFTSPLELPTERYAARDVTMHGVTIPRGELMFPVLASANRDESVFTNPDQLDITRADNRHVGFGRGVHFCVGAPLARLEGGIALNLLAQNAPGLRLAVPQGKLRWRPGYQVRGLEALPVRFA